MKLIISVIAVLVLIASAACSKEEPQAEAPKADVTGITGIINTQTGRIDTAKKALEDSKQVNQMIQDSAAEQRETIEKTQQ